MVKHPETAMAASRRGCQMLDRTRAAETPFDDRKRRRHRYRDPECARYRKVGVYTYATHPTTGVRCVGYAIGDEPVEGWIPGQPMPRTLARAARDPNCIFVAHNAGFDRIICDVILTGFGLPEIPLERWRCTQARARALALPPALENLAAVLHLENQKDVVGARVMLALSKPRKPRADEPADGVYFDEDPAKLAVVYRYCKIDVEAARELDRLLPELSGEEQALWALNERINGFGFHVDRAFVEAAQQIADAAAPELDAELAQITGGAVRHTTEVAKLRAWLAQQGCPTESLNKKTVATLRADDNMPAAARRALELRAAGGHAAFRKLPTLQAGLGADDRYRGSFTFHAAAPGRFAGSRFQVQNLKRIADDDIETAIALVATGDYAQVRAKYENPLAIVGQCLRATVCARPGHKLIGSDFAGIESRITAWLANEQSKLAVFRKFDETRDPLNDVYVVTAGQIFRKPAAAITKAERQTGKFCDLAFSFAGALGAFRNLAPAEVNAQFTDAQINQLKLAWRAAHPRIVALWHALNRAAIDAVSNPGLRIRCGRVVFESDDAPILWMTLPSGRRRAFPHARLAEDKYGLGITYQDNSAGQWRPERLYGGKILENCAQACARDLLAAALLRIDAAGFDITLHCHDEIVVEVADGFDDIDAFTEIDDHAAGLGGGVARHGQDLVEREVPLMSTADAFDRLGESQISTPRKARMAAAEKRRLAKAMQEREKLFALWREVAPRATRPAARRTARRGRRRTRSIPRNDDARFRPGIDRADRARTVARRRCRYPLSGVAAD